MQKIIELAKKHLSTIVFVAALVTLVALRLPMWIQSYQMEGKPAERTIIVDLEHNSFNFPEQLTKPSVLIFWATWCGVCKLELSRIQESINGNEIPRDNIYAISVGEDFKTVKAESEKRKYNFQVLIDSQGLLGHQFNIQALPTVVFLNKDSQVEWSTTGLTPTINFRIRSFLKP